MPKVVKKKSPATKRSKKSVLKVLPQSINTPSVSHGYASYEHHAELKKMNEKTQRLIMWTSIGAIMTIIVVVWILNLNSLIKAQSPAPIEQNTSKTDLEALKNDLKETLSQVKTDMDDLQQLAPTTNSITPNVEPSVTPSISPTTLTPNTLPN